MQSVDHATIAEQAMAALNVTAQVTVARPASAKELADLLAEANSRNVALVPWGGGSHQYVGNAPTRCDTIVQVDGLRGIQAYAPEDLTVSVGAGTTLAELQAVLSRHGQFLPIDVADPASSTIGGAVAIGASSLRRSRYGAARDLVIGVTVALADGSICKAGGRVVKNVAGYDLCKLFTGSLGTLGVLISVNLKVYPVPKVVRLVRGTLESPAQAFSCARKMSCASQYFSSVLVEIDGAAASAAVWALSEGFGGSLERQVAEARACVCSHNGNADVLTEADGWTELGRLARMRESPTHTGVVLNGSVKPAQLEDAWIAIGAAFANTGARTMIGDANTGTFTVACTQDYSAVESLAGVRDARTALHTLGGHIHVHGGRLELRASRNYWDGAHGGEELSRLIKSRLDAKGILNPGRHAYGI